MTSPAFRLRPLSAAAADQLRSRGATTYVADEHPGYPCRRCLRDAAIGEEVLLVSHDPFTTDTPYRSASPIFVHADGCEPPEDLRQPPVQLTSRRLSVRAFDRDEMMTEAKLIDGQALGETINSMFADEVVNSIHVHNAERGCWAVNIVRD